MVAPFTDLRDGDAENLTNLVLSGFITAPNGTRKQKNLIKSAISNNTFSCHTVNTCVLCTVYCVLCTVYCVLCALLFIAETAVKFIVHKSNKRYYLIFPKCYYFTVMFVHNLQTALANK